MHRRKRRLEKGELKRLEDACKDCIGLNKFYVRLAIYLAIETGMRLQEIFNLTWKDVNIDTRRIEIRKNKTDHLSEYAGRTIVMSIMSLYYLLSLADHLQLTKKDADTRVFPMKKEAFKQAWANLVKRAGITPSGDEGRRLTFHDLRREAGSIFDEAGLTKGEHDLMMGHANKNMTSLYIHANLEAIEEKLDRYRAGKHYDKWINLGKPYGRTPGQVMRDIVALTLAREKVEKEVEAKYGTEYLERATEAIKNMNMDTSNVVPLRRKA
jgi:integrase